MRIFNLLSLFAATAPNCFADVEFTSPAAGSSALANAIQIEWKDSGNPPLLSDLVTYSIDLMAGGNSDSDSVPISNISPLNTKFSGTSSVMGNVSPDMGGNAKNVYYLRITSIAATGGQMINFSPRFSISDMTGTFPAAVLSSLPITSTSARTSINQVDSSPAGAGGAFNMPYGEQTGLTRYAPMISRAPTAITKLDTSPLYPTSAYTVATTFLGIATVQTTITQSNTYTISQVENTAAPLAGPNAAAMQKFLNRWKD